MATATSSRQDAAFVRSLPLFSNVSPTDCGTIISLACKKCFRRRQVIFSQGDPLQQVVMLLSGGVKVTQLGFGGEEAILRLSGAGDVIGGFEPSADRRHVSTAQAVQPSSALVWQMESFEKLLERFPALLRNSVRALEKCLQELEQRFREVSTEKVRSRLSSELIRLSNQLGRRLNGTAEISLSRAELAQLTGTSMFTVSRLLCQWQSLGIVSIRREAVHVRDLAALVQLSQSE